EKLRKNWITIFPAVLLVFGMFFSHDVWAMKKKKLGKEERLYNLVQRGYEELYKPDKAKKKLECSKKLLSLGDYYFEKKFLKLYVYW
ncbi:hypothetical protein ACFLYU_04280, partial [Candidatus Dependentiae bacterium]